MKRFESDCGTEPVEIWDDAFIVLFSRIMDIAKVVANGQVNFISPNPP